MELPLSELLKYAEAHALEQFNICSGETWLAAKCASQLTGKKHEMYSYYDFSGFNAYRTVPKKYAELCRAERYKQQAEICVYLSGKQLAVKIRAMMDEEPDQPIIIGG